MIFLILILISFVNSHQFAEIDQVIDTIKSNRPKISHIDLSQIELGLDDVKNIENALQFNSIIGFIKWPFDSSKARGELRVHVTGIHQRLKINNLRFSRFANDMVVSALNIHANHVDSVEENRRLVFNDPPFTRLNQHIFEWTLKKLFRDDKSGYQARLYLNQANKQLVLIHKNFNQNLLTTSNESVKELFKNLALSHILEALASTKESIEIAKEETGFILFSGYSFGAWLAELSLLFANYDFNHKQSRAVVFESPGALEVYEYWKFKKNTQHSEPNIDLINYILFPNNLNSFGGNNGKLYQISNQEYENLFPFFGEHLPSYFEMFNEGTSFPDQFDRVHFLKQETFTFETNSSGDLFESIIRLPKFEQMSSFVENIIQGKLALSKVDESVLERQRIDIFSHKLYPHQNLIDKYLIKVFELRDSDIKNEIFKDYVQTVKQICSLKSEFFQYVVETNPQHYTVEQVKEYLHRLLTVAPDFKLLLSLVSRKNLKRKLLSNYPNEETQLIERIDLIEAIEHKFYYNQVVALYSTDRNGKTSLANLYAHKRLSDSGLIWWFQGNSIDSEFRSFANLCLKLKTWKYEKESLIKEAKRVFFKFNFKVLFVFDDVKSFEKIEDYIYDLPSNFKILITTRDKSFIQIFAKNSLQIDGFSRKETNEYLRKYLPDSFAITDDSKSLFEVAGETIKEIEPVKLSTIMSYLKIDNSITIKEFVNNGKKIENLVIFDLIKKKSPKLLKLLEYLSFLDSDFVWVDLVCDLMKFTQKELKIEIDYLAEVNLVTIEEVNHLFGIKLKKVFVQDLRNNCQDSLKEISKDLIQTLNKYFEDIHILSDDTLLNAKLVYPHLKVLLSAVDHQVFLEVVPGIFGDLLRKLSFYEAIINLDYVKSIEYEIIFAEKIDQDQTLVSESLSNIGKYLRKKFDLKDALEYLQKSFELKQSLYPEDSLNKANTLREIGLVFMQLGNMEKALDILVKSLEMSRNLKNEESIGESLIYVGFAHLNLHQTDNFLTFFNESISNFRNFFKDPIKKHNLLSFLVILKFYISTGNYEVCSKFFSKNFELFKIMDNENFERSELIFNLAEEFLNDNSKYKNIFDDKFLEIYKDFNSPNDKISAITLTNIGILYFINKNYEKSTEFLEKSLTTFQSIRSKPDENVYFTYKVLARSYESSYKLFKSLNCFINSLGMMFRVFHFGDALKRNILSIQDLFRLYSRSFSYQILGLVIFTFLKFYYGKKVARVFVLFLIGLFFTFYYFS